MQPGIANCPDGADEGPFCRAKCGRTPTPPKEDNNAMLFRNLVAGRADGFNSRIKGGDEATPHSLIWNVAMLSYAGEHVCGGSIVSDLHSPIRKIQYSFTLFSPKSYVIKETRNNVVLSMAVD